MRSGPASTSESCMALLAPGDVVSTHPFPWKGVELWGGACLGQRQIGLLDTGDYSFWVLVSSSVKREQRSSVVVGPGHCTRPTRGRVTALVQRGAGSQGSPDAGPARGTHQTAAGNKLYEVLRGPHNVVHPGEGTGGGETEDPRVRRHSGENCRWETQHTCYQHAPRRPVPGDVAVVFFGCDRNRSWLRSEISSQLNKAGCECLGF